MTPLHRKEAAVPIRVARRGESEAPSAAGAHKFSLLGGRRIHDKDTPSVPPERESAKKKEDDKSPKQFLKRRTKKVEPVKVDWKNVGRRIDCWNPKKKRDRNQSQNERKTQHHPQQQQQNVICLKQVNPKVNGAAAQQAPKSDKKATPIKSPSSAKLLVKKNRTVVDDKAESGSRAVGGSEKKDTQKRISRNNVRSRERVAENVTPVKVVKKERMDTKDLLKLYDKYHGNGNTLEEDSFGKHEDSLIPYLKTKAAFFDTCTTSYEVSMVA